MQRNGTIDQQMNITCVKMQALERTLGFTPLAPPFFDDEICDHEV